MTFRHIPISEAARLHNVARSTIQRKIVKGELERVMLKDGTVGVTVASLKAVFGEPQEDLPHAAPSPEIAAGARHGAALPRGSAARQPHAAGAAAAPSDDEATVLRERLAAAEAASDELRKALAHERADRAAERATFQTAFENLSRQLIAVKGADYARDMRQITEGQAIDATPVKVKGKRQPSKADNPASPLRGYSGTAQDDMRPIKQTEYPRSGLAGLWGWLRR